MTTKNVLMRRVFIASPLRAGNGFTFEDNLDLARRLCLAVCRAGHAAYAPHVFYTSFLDDKLQTDRELGMRAGREWLKVCSDLWLYAWNEDECSPGMVEEVNLAKSLAVPPRISWMPDVFRDVPRKL